MDTIVKTSAEFLIVGHGRKHPTLDLCKDSTYLMIDKDPTCSPDVVLDFRKEVIPPIHSYNFVVFVNSGGMLIKYQANGEEHLDQKSVRSIYNCLVPHGYLLIQNPFGNVMTQISDAALLQKELEEYFRFTGAKTSVRSSISAPPFRETYNVFERR